MAIFFKSQRGKDKLAYGGFIYLQDGHGETGERWWYCEEYKKTLKCLGRAKTDPNNNVTVTHGPQME